MSAVPVCQEPRPWRGRGRGWLCLPFLTLAWVQHSRLVAGVAAPAIIQELRASMPQHSVVAISSGLGWDECAGGTIFRPAHTEQLADIVMNIHRDHQVTGQKYIIRATHSHFMSHNNFSCASAGADPDVHSVVVDMSDMAQVLEFNDDLETVTVQAGITIEALERVLLEYDMSLPGVVIAPQIGGVTLGAAIVTSAHGSSLVGPAGIAAYLHSAVIVDGTGEIHALEQPGDLLEGSLGMLGIVTEVTMYVSPKRKIAVRELQSEDYDMVADLRDIIDNSEAMSLDVTWNPTAGMYHARVWHETDRHSRGDARNVFLQPPADWLDKINERLHRDQLDVHDREGFMCEVIGELSHFPYFAEQPRDVDAGTTEPLPREEGLPQGTAIGWLNHMASATCPHGKACIWSVAKWTPYELAIPSQDFSSWLADARSILKHATGCPPFLIHLRFIGESDAPLALSSGRQVVAIEISTFSSRRGRGLPVKFQRLHEEVVQMTLCRYSGRPSWSLGTNRLFTGPCPVRDLYGSAFDTFLEQRQVYDPAGLLLPPLFSKVINREGPDYYPGCAAHMDCFCQQDAHCGAGHACVPGFEHPEFKVCAPLPDTTKHEL